MSEATVGSFLFDYIHSLGVGHAFALPGDFALPTFACLERSKIECVNMTHEPSVGFAADGYARINGLGLAVVTYCVGGLNMLNSIAGAWAEKSPVIVVSGGPGTQDRRGDMLLHHKVRTFDTQRRIYDEVTCASAVLLDPGTAVAEIMRVVDAVLEHKRPGYIEVPYDMPSQPIPQAFSTNNRPIRECDHESLHACVDECTAALCAASNPVILAGIELQRHGLASEALALAESLNIPIAATLLSKSVIRENHPLYIGTYSSALSEPGCQKCVDGSDCVLMLGAFVTDMFLGMDEPRLSRAKTIAISADGARAGVRRYDGFGLKEFLPALRACGIQARPAFDNPNPAREPEPLSSGESADMLTSTETFRILGLHLDNGAAVVADTGDALFGAIGLRTAHRKEFIATAYYCTMGFSVPAAIGVSMARGRGHRVLVVVGDGAFQMTGTEISSAVRLGLPLTIVILNNDGYGTQRRIMDGPFNEILGWDYAKVCESLGAKTSGARTKGGLDAALKDAATSAGPYVIEVKLARDDASEPLRNLTREMAKLRSGTGDG